MRHRPRMIVLASLVIACAGLGCSSESGSGDPVPASISSGDSGTTTENGSTSSSGPAVDQGDPLHPVVEIETSQGTITLELDAESAPGTVRNFLNYVNSGHYDQTVFHYIEPGSIILGGGYTVDLEAKETLGPIRNEAHNGLKNKRGTIAMSRQYESIDSATCQFFINLTDNVDFDHQEDAEDGAGYGYCVFGKVTDGLDVAEKIGQAPTHDDGDFVSTPKQRVVIQAVRMIR